MGTKRSINDVLGGPKEKTSVPPGFVSLTSLTFKRIKSPRATNATDVGQEFIPDSVCAPFSNSHIEKSRASFSTRPSICHQQSDCFPQELDTEQHQIETEHTVSNPLPKGVIRGCSNCQDCAKVNARCHPADSRLPDVDDAPVFRPTEEEFKDTLKYIAEIRPQAENFGICRIIPPPSWEPPCLLKDGREWDPSKFNTHIQRIDGLRNFYLERKLSGMHEKVEAEGPEETTECISMNPEYELGPDLSLQSFKNYADDFKKQLFSKNERVVDTEIEVLQEPLIARIEGEYWRIIENPTEEIEVLFGANLGSQTLRSGFPVRDSHAEISPYSEYVKSGWNLNNTPKLPCSLLPYGCHGTSEILNPQLFIGMCFASQCWRREDHHLYSLSYVHIGDPKVWYGVPGRYRVKFMNVVRKLFPQLSKHPELIHKLVTQISPSKLRSEGIPVYRCVQNRMEFILTFPGAYHSEFSCGFNCSEAVCFAPLDWLPHGQIAVELYSDYCQKTSISHDMLLLRAATGAVCAQWEFVTSKTTASVDELWRSGCRLDGILTKSLKARVKLESTVRKYLCNNVPASEMVNEVDSDTKKECRICLCDLYLSAVGCSCSPNKYTCLYHARNLCDCPWWSKRFLFRHTISDLNLLVEALEGNNLAAILDWAKKPETGSITSKNSLQSGSRCNTDSVHARNGISSMEKSRPVVHGAGGEQTKVPPNQNLVILLSDGEDE